MMRRNTLRWSLRSDSASHQLPFQHSAPTIIFYLKTHPSCLCRSLETISLGEQTDERDVNFLSTDNSRLSTYVFLEIGRICNKKSFNFAAINTKNTEILPWIRFIVVWILQLWMAPPQGLLRVSGRWLAFCPTCRASPSTSQPPLAPGRGSQPWLKVPGEWVLRRAASLSGIYQSTAEARSDGGLKRLDQLSIVSLQ